MLNPQWLKSFVLLAQCGSFTRAAEQLDLTQAAVSQHIAHLEKQLGPLFIRHPRQLELTPTGGKLLDYCREIEALDRRFVLRLAETDSEHGEISFITPGSIGLALYPLLLDYQKRHPGLIIRHRFAPDHEVLQAVLHNRSELGLLTQKPDDPLISATLFAREPLELIASAAARLESWQDLVQLGFIDHPDGQAMASRLLSRVFPAQARMRELPCRGFSNQIGLILEPVARGLGFTVLPRHARQAFARQEAIQVLYREVQVVDTLWLIHRAQWPLSSRAERVLAHVRAQMAQQASS